MPYCDLEIQIAPQFQGRLKEDSLRRAVEETLSVEGFGSVAELSLVITDDETVQELNRRFRGIDQPTDVLSFALLEEKEAPPFALPPDGVFHLGEVIISYPQAARQAEEYHHSIEKEILLLTIHGVLHLLGHEHEEPEQEKMMKALEVQILRRCYE